MLLGLLIGYAVITVFLAGMMSTNSAQKIYREAMDREGLSAPGWVHTALQTATIVLWPISFPLALISSALNRKGASDDE